MKKKYLIRVTVFFLIAAFLEIFVFNYKFFATRGLSPIDVTETLKRTGMVQEEGIWKAEPEEFPCFSLAGIDEELKGLYLDLEVVPAETSENEGKKNLLEKSSKGILMEFWANDVSHKEAFYLGYRMMANSVESSRYVTFQTRGKSDELKIYISEMPEGAILLHKAVINPRVPVFFSFVRLLLCWGIMLFLSMALAKDEKSYNSYCGTWKQKSILVIIVVAQMMLFVSLAHANPAFTYAEGESKTQYQNLAHSLRNGKVYLEFEPSEVLKQMENPYDRTYRDKLMTESGESYRWDHAYYEGKYYVYFGIVPELIFYYPYYLLTGQDFQTHIGIYIAGCLFLVGSMFLLIGISKKWFSRTSFANLILLYLAFVNCGGVLGFMARPDFYSLPILTGIMFSVWGLWLWITSQRETGYNPIKIFFGSLCMALVAGCRPQLVLVSTLAIIFFWKGVWKSRTLFSRKGKLASIAFVMPYLFVAAGLMYYNWIRFDSVFDFGAVYNLTGTDIPNRGFTMGRIFQGIFMYGFQFPNIKMVFPFLEAVNGESMYLGEFVRTKMYGGIFITCPLLWMGIWALWKKNWFVNKETYYSIICLGVCGILVMIVDSQMAGILWRYITDFAWIFLLASCFAVMGMEDYLQGSEKKHGLRKGLLFCVGISLVFYLLMTMVSTALDGDNIYDCNPVIYSKIQHLVAFWS